MRILWTILALMAATSSGLVGQQKLAQTGMKFLNVGTNARMTAMAEAFTAVEASSPSLFYNPASMSRTPFFVDVSLGQTQWIADIKHHYASASISPFDARYGVLGFSIMAVDYGELYETIRWPNAEGYIDLGTFKPTAMLIGLGYANAISDRFSVGGNVKYVIQRLGSTVVRFDDSDGLIRSDNEADVIAFDMGVLYRTGFRSLNFGMTIRNFSREVRFEREGFQLPLIFRIGLAMNMMDLFEVDRDLHSFLLAVDAAHPRDFPEQLNIGGEYVFMRLLALRAGYMFNNDEHGFTAGLGLQQQIGDMHLSVDYSYTPFGVFDKVHRISFEFAY